jgi:hypothetical protein
MIGGTDNTGPKTPITAAALRWFADAGSAAFLTAYAAR